MAGLSLLSKLPSLSPTSLFAARSASDAASSRSLPSPLRRLCPFFPLYESRRSPIVGAGIRCFSTLLKTPSQNDPAPVEKIPEGCDFKHWLVHMETPEPNLTRDEIIDRYIKTLAQVVGSEEEARMKIYSVSTKYYFAFGALLSEELSRKIEGLPKVMHVLPDCYEDVENQNYGGEPFLDGQAVPYDPKYHGSWAYRCRIPKKKYGTGERGFLRPREKQNFNITGTPPISSDVTPSYGNKRITIWV